MIPTTITVRELHQDLPRIAAKVKRGQRFIVVKHAVPLFSIGPAIEPLEKPQYTMADFAKIQFKGGKNLSRDIDKILYGV